MDKQLIKRKQILERIESIEAALVRAQEYLESGKHAHWTGFRPLLTQKMSSGKPSPPHKDWVANVFIPNHEKSLRRAERALERVEASNDRNSIK